MRAAGEGLHFVLFEDKKVSFCDTKKIYKIVTSSKAMSFGLSGLRPLARRNRSLTSLGVPIGGAMLDIV
jgi:hypothetical protein